MVGMIEFLYSEPRRRKDSGKRYKLCFKICKFIANFLYPIKARFHRNVGVDKNSNVIISLTSFPARIDNVWITIETLLNQSVKPARIQLYLAEEQFPDGDLSFKEITRKRFEQQKLRGLEVIYCDDLRPHKKYYYAMKDNPDNIVITVDDDMLYPENLVDELLRAHKKYPDSVVCEYAHKITFDENGKLIDYWNWPDVTGDWTKPDMRILPVGCGGVLYPPHCLDERVFDKDKLREICLSTDDLWLKVMELLKGTKAAVVKPGGMIYFDIVGTRKSSLQHSNCEGNNNNRVLEKIIKEWPEILSNL